MSQIIDLESRRRRCAPAQHGSRPTAPHVQHAPILDEICRRIGPRGWIVVDGAGHVVEVHDPRGAA